MSQRIQIKRGLKSALPTSGMLPGEMMVTTDRGTAHVAIDATTKKPIVPAIDDLSTMPAIDGAADLLIIHDASETTGQKEKKATINELRTALAIPEGSTDEKVAAVSGGTPGYIFGTDGTDGVVRVDSSMTITKAAGNTHVTLGISTIDCGTF